MVTASELQAGRPCHDAGRCFFTIGDRLHIAAPIYCFSRTLDLRSHSDKVNRVSGLETALTRSLVSPI
ncbi:hypothetical protein AVDCRST_MAG84-1376 [uncultured Microcoleus sp.]|uniref:Uncharacterized protein n=1 Tax=uncultured Microcoleus sp. TaxID=259945 RepID=A0A6J4L1P5_9CYAN|nr:hypothetical protein AVDCRST_MAG84-1376 [uncultured Microcoleus sp.]